MAHGNDRSCKIITLRRSAHRKKDSFALCFQLQNFVCLGQHIFKLVVKSKGQIMSKISHSLFWLHLRDCHRRRVFYRQQSFLKLMTFWKLRGEDIVKYYGPIFEEALLSLSFRFEFNYKNVHRDVQAKSCNHLKGILLNHFKKMWTLTALTWVQT